MKIIKRKKSRETMSFRLRKKSLNSSINTKVVLENENIQILKL